jgi:hypothetical protein
VLVARPRILHPAGNESPEELAKPPPTFHLRDDRCQLTGSDVVTGAIPGEDNVRDVELLDEVIEWNRQRVSAAHLCRSRLVFENEVIASLAFCDRAFRGHSSSPPLRQGFERLPWHNS